MTIQIFDGDLPSDLDLGETIAIDTEATGLRFSRDRLCLVQLSSGDGNSVLVTVEKGQVSAPNLCALLTDRSKLKLFHFARFDIAMLAAQFDVITAPIYCTKIASRLARTYTDRHSLRDLCQTLLSQDISKKQQCSDWAKRPLTNAQKKYAATDVIYLHRLREILDEMLKREGRLELAKSCFEFLPVRAELDLSGWPDVDIFAH